MSGFLSPERWRARRSGWPFRFPSTLTKAVCLSKTPSRLLVSLQRRVAVQCRRFVQLSSAEYFHSRFPVARYLFLACCLRRCAASHSFQSSGLPSKCWRAVCHTPCRIPKRQTPCRGGSGYRRTALSRWHYGARVPLRWRRLPSAFWQPVTCSYWIPRSPTPQHKPQSAYQTRDG